MLVALISTVAVADFQICS